MKTIIALCILAFLCTGCFESKRGSEVRRITYDANSVIEQEVYAYTYWASNKVSESAIGTEVKIKIDANSITLKFKQSSSEASYEAQNLPETIDEVGDAMLPIVGGL